jgi:predicted ArsR family transcriptional regulator
MKSTRERILHTLVSQPRSTISELAEAVDINAISVRHHLTSLQADGLIAAEEERHGVGRPRLVYFLTETGMEKFPTRYFRLTNRLLDQIKGTFSEQMVQQLFQKMADDLTTIHLPKTQGLNTEQKLDLIREVLGQEGFQVSWHKVDDHYEIREISCPYLHVGQTHPEICAVDQRIISTLLAIPAEKIRCVLRGDAHCTYVIPPMEGAPSTK